MEYRSAIVDELGEVVKWCENLSEKDIEEILTDFPEYQIVCIEV